ncbi:unnamed protein product [Mytilus edulis]|uniref:Uncharacterized protein n=1 Tax=Mytilus edulis TaxID=6550 RepID=A0A8S3TPN0_MYTED|nr:unnamed protein product [Mytilus edulis]
MKRITTRVQEIDRDNVETRGSYTCKSRSSHSSHSHRSSASQRSQTASRAADLTIKLKYIEIEAKAKLKLERIQTIRELEATEAKLDVIDKASQGSDLDELKKSLPEDNILDKFLQHVNPYAKSKSTPNVRPSILDQSALNASQSFVQSESSVPVMTHMRSEPVVTNVNSMPVVTSVSSATLNPSAITFVPQNVNTANVTGQYVQIEDLTKSLAEQVSLSRLPPPEPSVFFGDPLKYPAWKSSFQTLIEQRKIPTFERIHYLRKYVGDSVREVIENFLILSTQKAHDDAKELLEKRFGDPFIISNAFRDRLDNWPKGHTSKKCQKRKKCEVCSRFHPTSLHGDFQKPIISVNKDKPLETGTVENYKSQTGAVFMNNTKASCKSSMIVPVYVSHSDDPENERLVYALLDTQSDTTFVLDETRRALGLCGTDVKLSLSTMHAENHIVDSRKIKGLVVRGFDSEVRIPLPQVFTRDIMPANRSHIPTAEMARRWS